LSVFECQSNRKPKAAGWRDLEYWMIDGEEADSWVCYGIPLESNWLVVDVDLRKPEAHDSFARLSAFVDFSETFRCKTARGGWHYWFKNPTNQPIRKNLNEYAGIDFLSDGCYVIGPSSIANTGTYAYEDGELTETREAPSALLGILQKVELQKIDSEPISGVQSSLESSRYKQWLDAQPGSILGQNSNDYTYNMAAYGFDFGLSEQEVFEAMFDWNETCSPPWPLEKLKVRIANAGRYAQNKKGKAAIQFEVFTAEPVSSFPDALPAKYTDTKYDDAFYEALHPGVEMIYRGSKAECNSTNMRIALLSDRYKGLFAYDIFRGKIILCRVPPWRGNIMDQSLEMRNTDWVELRVDLAIQGRFEAPDYLVEDGVTAMALARSIHPICDWLSELKWDGVPRFHKLFGSDKYKINVIKTFLLASIYRIFEPGYKFDHMLVLAGAQGIGKSYLVQTLGGEFTTTMQHMPTDRKGLQELEGSWWIELPELSAVKKADINQIKAFITSTKDSYIPMYGKNGRQDFPRICIPVWTLNPTEVGFITDDVNRRFLIIEVKERVDIEYVKSNRDQIFAEAMELYKQGVKPHDIVATLAVQAEEIAQANKQDDSDPWEEPIANWLANKENDRVKSNEVLKGALEFYLDKDLSVANKMRVTTCLKRLGWVKLKTMGSNVWVKNDEEMDEPEFEV